MKRTLTTIAIVAVLALSSLRAQAQDKLEVAVGLWSPRADIVVASDGGGVAGTPLDLRQDAGLTDGHFPAIALTARVAARHKIRFEYLPIAFDSSATLTRDVTFSGATYPRGTAITSAFDWKSYAAGYEYDFLVKPRWTAGLIVEARQTDIQERLSSAASTEARRTRVPAPLAGGTLRVDPVDRLSLALEITGFKVPDSADRHYGGHYFDLKAIGTIHVTRYVGAQAGYRFVDIGHLGESDSATLTLKGVYVGVAVRR